MKLGWRRVLLEAWLGLGLLAMKKGTRAKEGVAAVGCRVLGERRLGRIEVVGVVEVLVRFTAWLINNECLWEVGTRIKFTNHPFCQMSVSLLLVLLLQQGFPSEI